ncbi:PNPOx family protein [Microlunatus ginsengisoli]|uniref:Uncharacterized protein n=1 Tax=Microlunatus ginsengisoli TaxID=363863 RepID=A0ABP6ZRF9_9ACTN
MRADPARLPRAVAAEWPVPERVPLDAWSYRSAFRGRAAGVGVVTADDGRDPVVRQVPAGDHRILIVLLDRFEQRRPYAPLVFAGGRYGTAAPSAP